jgi:hypothetical protein
MSQRINPVVVAFDQMLKELYKQCLRNTSQQEQAAAQQAWELLRSFGWDQDKYLGQDDYRLLREKHKNHPPKMLIIDFMDTHLGRKPVAGITALGKLINDLQLIDAEAISSRTSDRTP